MHIVTIVTGIAAQMAFSTNAIYVQTLDGVNINPIKHHLSTYCRSHDELVLLSLIRDIRNTSNSVNVVVRQANS